MSNTDQYIEEEVEKEIALIQSLTKDLSDEDVKAWFKPKRGRTQCQICHIDKKYAHRVVIFFKWTYNKKKYSICSLCLGSTIAPIILEEYKKVFSQTVDSLEPAVLLEDRKAISNVRTSGYTDCSIASKKFNDIQKIK